MRDLPCRRIEVDEIWAFCYAKDKAISRGQVKAGHPRAGSIWTWTSVCADTRLMPAWAVGDRSFATAVPFMRDLASRLRHRVQLTTDGHQPYIEAVDEAFGGDGCTVVAPWLHRRPWSLSHGGAGSCERLHRVAPSKPQKTAHEGGGWSCVLIRKNGATGCNGATAGSLASCRRTADGLGTLRGARRGVGGTACAGPLHDGRRGRRAWLHRECQRRGARRSTDKPADRLGASVGRLRERPGTTRGWPPASSVADARRGGPRVTGVDREWTAWTAWTANSLEHHRVDRRAYRACNRRRRSTQGFHCKMAVHAVHAVQAVGAGSLASCRRTADGLWDPTRRKARGRGYRMRRALVAPSGRRLHRPAEALRGASRGCTAGCTVRSGKVAPSLHRGCTVVAP